MSDRRSFTVPCHFFFSSSNLNHLFSSISRQIDVLINLEETLGFPNPICSAVMGPLLHFFSFCSHPVSTRFPSRYDIFAPHTQALYLSARCLRAEDDLGNYPSTLLLPEQFSCVLAVASELQMKETQGDALGVWDQHAA